jgi:hypothetical protein
MQVKNQIYLKHVLLHEFICRKTIQIYSEAKKALRLIISILFKVIKYKKQLMTSPKLKCKT